MFQIHWIFFSGHASNLKKPTGNWPVIVVKPWAGWGRHPSSELWRTVCKSHFAESSAGVQWHPCVWYHTAARPSLGHPVLVRVSSVTWELHTQGHVAQRVWHMAQRQHCRSEGQREELDEAIRNPPSLHGQHQPGLCIPASVRSSLLRLFWKSNKWTSLQHSCCCSPTSMEQELAPLWKRCGSFHLCSTISCDHYFVQFISVILTQVAQCRGDHSSGISRTIFGRIGFFFGRTSFLSLAMWTVLHHMEACRSCRNSYLKALLPKDGPSLSQAAGRYIWQWILEESVCSVAPWKTGDSRVVYQAFPKYDL